MATVDIPRQQKAAVKVGSGEDAKAPVQQVDVPTPGPGEVLVKINWYGYSRVPQFWFHPLIRFEQDWSLCF